jgi:hypothetical protein
MQHVGLHPVLRREASGMLQRNTHGNAAKV